MRIVLSKILQYDQLFFFRMFSLLSKEHPVIFSDTDTAFLDLHLSVIHFIIYKVVKYRKILLIYNVYFIFSLVKI